MTDVHSKETRSYNMSRVRSKNTKPEMLVRKFLFSKGYRYRLHDKKLPGKPDIVLPKFKTVIFIHGCFWHGHEHCKYSALPKTNSEWWSAKICANIKNDNQAIDYLESKGWKILTVWGCNLKSKSIRFTLQELIDKIKE